MKKIISAAAAMLAFVCAAFAIDAQEWANYARYEKDNMSVEKRPVAVLMGDSITEGWFAHDPQFFADNNFAGRGIGGQVTPQMLLRFQRDVVELKPKFVVILAGTNDIAQNSGAISPEDIMRNIASMCEIAAANKIKPVLCSVLPAYEYKWNPSIKEAAKQIEELNTLIKEYAKNNKIPYVDYHKEMADDRGGLPPELSPDEVHPNLEGYKVMEGILLKALAKAKK